MELTNSKRSLPTATYVAVELERREQDRAEREDGRALDKINFLRQARLSRDDIVRAREALMHEALEGLDPIRIRQALVDFEAVVDRLGNARQDQPNLALAPQAARIPAVIIARVADLVAEQSGHELLGLKVEAFKKRMKTSPVGRLHLERIEMYPAGIQRGELVFTVPMAPRETVTISHKEWSASAEEYERIVQDYFESYSEKGVAEKTDVSMSMENESKHARALNFSSSVSGGFGPISTSVSLGLTSSAEDRIALKRTMQRVFEVTEKASSRTRQEHKISVKLETKKGVEDSSFRTITNPSDDKTMRVDYYRMMRKWRTDLFRYGLRLTFDVAIPTPGARLWALHRRLRELDLAIGQPFSFALMPTELTDADWPAKAAQYGVALSPPLSPTIPLTQTKNMTASGGGNETFVFMPPENYHLSLEVAGHAMWHGPHTGMPPMMFPPNVQVQSTAPTSTLAGGGTFTFKGHGFGSKKQAVFPVMYGSSTILIDVTMGADRDPVAFAAWQNASWAALRDAALAAHQANAARLQAERDLLWMALAGKDTLTLRRLEREELIRQTLYWLIGIEFDPAPGEVSKVVKKIIDIEQHDAADESIQAVFKRLLQNEWATAAGFGDLVKFLHQAVEWENLLYFLYPYFWGSDDVGRERMLFEHPDPNHREFLRAGYARVVVPVRPGFEQSFTEFIDTGSFAGPGNSPYMTIAEEVAAFARTNYAGIPPANPEAHARPLLYPEQRSTWKTMEGVIAKIEVYAATHGGNYPPNLTSLGGGPYQDSWGRDLVYKLPGSGNDYDLCSYGADGEPGGVGLNADISAAAAASLVASWFDYTPTSGIDIEMDTKPDVIA